MSSPLTAGVIYRCYINWTSTQVIKQKRVCYKMVGVTQLRMLTVNDLLLVGTASEVSDHGSMFVHECS